MGCGCNNGSKSKQEYVVTTPDGKEIIVNSRTEALALVRKSGGTWRPKPS